MTENNQVRIGLNGQPIPKLGGILSEEQRAEIKVWTHARSLLVELTSLDNGENNGSLYLSVRDGARRMGVADLTAASRAFDNLVELGFIEMTQDAHFRVKAADKSRARCWRLTWLAGPGRKGPSMDFMNREPEPKTQAHKRMDRGLRALKEYRKANALGHLPVLDSDILAPDTTHIPAATVADSNTPNSKNGGFLPKCSVRDSATHIAVTMGKGSQGGLIGWWQPDWTAPLANLACLTSIATNQPHSPHNRGIAA